MRTLVTRRGRAVETPYEDAEALELLRDMVADGRIASSFGNDLSAKSWSGKGLSEEQMIWVHILVVEATAKKEPATVELGSFERIAQMFATAGQTLKHPKARLQVGDYRIKLYVAGERSRTPGHVQVCEDVSFYSGGAYFGRIDPEGRFHEGRSAKDCPELIAMLKRFAADPEGVAAEYGKLVGACCFCGTEIKTEESLAVGYGPVCAKNYGLAWGKVAVEVEQEVVAA